MAWASLDVFEERETLQDKGEGFLGLLFSMDDLVMYGYRTSTGLKIVIGLALIDGTIKDIDALTICKAIHQLYIRTTSNPFLPPSMHNEHITSRHHGGGLGESKKMREGAELLGSLLDGGRRG